MFSPHLKVNEYVKINANKYFNLNKTRQKSTQKDNHNFINKNKFLIKRNKGRLNTTNGQ
jgi:hypothetical protein